MIVQEAADAAGALMWVMSVSSVILSSPLVIPPCYIISPGYLPWLSPHVMFSLCLCLLPVACDCRGRALCRPALLLLPPYLRFLSHYRHSSSPALFLLIPPFIPLLSLISSSFYSCYFSFHSSLLFSLLFLLFLLFFLFTFFSLLFSLLCTVIS